VLVVTLNPERDSIIKTHLEDLNLRPLPALNEATSGLTRAATQGAPS
jgi:hypothetical protein